MVTTKRCHWYRFIFKFYQTLITILSIDYLLLLMKKKRVLIKCLQKRKLLFFFLLTKNLYQIYLCVPFFFFSYLQNKKLKRQKKERRKEDLKSEEVFFGLYADIRIIGFVTRTKICEHYSLQMLSGCFPTTESPRHWQTADDTLTTTK